MSKPTVEEFIRDLVAKKQAEQIDELLIHGARFAAVDFGGEPDLRPETIAEIIQMSRQSNNNLKLLRLFLRELDEGQRIELHVYWRDQFPELPGLIEEIDGDLFSSRKQSND